MLRNFRDSHLTKTPGTRRPWRRNFAEPQLDRWGSCILVYGAEATCVSRSIMRRTSIVDVSPLSPDLHGLNLSGLSPPMDRLLTESLASDPLKLRPR